jgi:hypothetical protein
MRRATASGSMRFSRLVTFSSLLKVLLPEPFGPAMTVKIGTF